MYFERSATLLSKEGAAQVKHYLERNEYEMAFEGLVLELMSSSGTPPNFVFDDWKSLAEEMKVDTEPVFDGEFWAKFLQWGRGRRG